MSMLLTEEKREHRRNQKALRVWLTKTMRLYRSWQAIFPRCQIWVRPVGYYGSISEIEINFKVSKVEDVQRIADMTGRAFIMKMDRFDGITYESENWSDNPRVEVTIKIEGIQKVGDYKVGSESERTFFIKCPGDKEPISIPEAVDRGIILQNIHPKGGQHE